MDAYDRMTTALAFFVGISTAVLYVLHAEAVVNALTAVHPVAIALMGPVGFLLYAML